MFTITSMKNPNPTFTEPNTNLIFKSTQYGRSVVSLSVLTAIFQVNLGLPEFIEAKDDGGCGDN